MSTAGMRTYRLEENEALEGRQVVSVSEEASGRSIWTKTRELAGDEIVSIVFDSLHNPRWIVHRPTRGWYLRLRRAAPPLPPQDTKPPASVPPDTRLVELRAVKRSRRTRPEKSGVELEFQSETLPFPSRDSDSGRSRSETRVDMSPTAEPFFPSGPSILEGNGASTSATSTSPTRHRKRPSSVSAAPPDPLSPTPRDTATSGSSIPPIRTRVGSTFRVRPLARKLPGGTSGLLRRLRNLVWDGEPKGFECVWWSTTALQEGAEKLGEEKKSGGLDEVDEADRVVLRFVEQPTSFLQPRLSGQLSLNPSLVHASGLEPSFWIALACAVCECEEEREGWEAAKEG